MPTQMRAVRALVDGAHEVAGERLRGSAGSWRNTAQRAARGSSRLRPLSVPTQMRPRRSSCSAITSGWPSGRRSSGSWRQARHSLGVGPVVAAGRRRRCPSTGCRRARAIIERGRCRRPAWRRVAGRHRRCAWRCATAMSSGTRRGCCSPTACRRRRPRCRDAQISRCAGAPAASRRSSASAKRVECAGAPGRSA